MDAVREHTVPEVLREQLRPPARPQHGPSCIATRPVPVLPDPAADAERPESISSVGDKDAAIRREPERGRTHPRRGGGLVFPRREEAIPKDRPGHGLDHPVRVDLPDPTTPDVRVATFENVQASIRPHAQARDVGIETSVGRRDAISRTSRARVVPRHRRDKSVRGELTNCSAVRDVQAAIDLAGQRRRTAGGRGRPPSPEAGVAGPATVVIVPSGPRRTRKLP